jgi:transposase
MNGLALQVEEALRRNPHAGDLYVFRGGRDDLIKILWHDGLGMSLYAKRLERGRLIWPSPADGVVSISASQLAYMLDGHRLEEPSSYLQTGTRGIVAAIVIFKESSAEICDSIESWIRILVRFPTT